MSCDSALDHAGLQTCTAGAGISVPQMKATWASTGDVHRFLYRCASDATRGIRGCGRFLSPTSPVCQNCQGDRAEGEQVLQYEKRRWPPPGVAFTGDAGKAGQAVADVDVLEQKAREALDAKAASPWIESLAAVDGRRVDALALDQILGDEQRALALLWSQDETLETLAGRSSDVPWLQEMAATRLSDKEALRRLADRAHLSGVRQEARDRLQEMGLDPYQAETAARSGAGEREIKRCSCGAILPRSGECRSKRCKLSPLYKDRDISRGEVRAAAENLDWIEGSTDVGLLCAVAEEYGLKTQAAQESIGRLSELKATQYLGQDALGQAAISRDLPDWQRMQAINHLDDEGLLSSIATNDDNSLAVQRLATRRIKDKARLKTIVTSPKVNRLTAMAAFGCIKDPATLAEMIAAQPSPVTPAAALEAVERIAAGGRKDTLGGRCQDALTYIAASRSNDVTDKVREAAISRLNSVDRLNAVARMQKKDDRVQAMVARRRQQLLDDDQAPGTPPWKMTQRGYQERQAVRAGGVPILNYDDRREHERMVREAVAQGWDVPRSVLADYPDLAQRQARAWSAFASRPPTFVQEWSATRKRLESVEVSFDPEVVGQALVRSESGEQYVVRFDSCECPQFEYRRPSGPCRHMRAVAEAAERISPRAATWWQRQAPRTWQFEGAQQTDETETQRPTYARQIEPDSPAAFWQQMRREESEEAAAVT